MNSIRTAVLKCVEASRILAGILYAELTVCAKRNASQNSAYGSTFAVYWT